MENRINKIMTLADGRKYFILRQAIYQGTNYYVADLVSEDESKLMEKFVILEEIKKDDKIFIDQLNDSKKIELIMKYLDIK